MPITDETNPYATSEPVENLDPGSVPALPAPQRVRFTDVLENIIAFNVYRALHNPLEIRSRRNTRRVCVYPILVMVILFLINKLLPAFQGEAQTLDFPSYLLVLLGIVFAWFVWRITNPRRIPDIMKAQFKIMLGEAPHPSIEIPCEVTIDASGIAIDEPYASRRLAWPAIEAVVIEPQYLFLLQSSILAHIVPRSAFPNERAYLGFANLARQLWQEHKGTIE